MGQGHGTGVQEQSGGKAQQEGHKDLPEIPLGKLPEELLKGRVRPDQQGDHDDQHRHSQQQAQTQAAAALAQLQTPAKTPQGLRRPADAQHEDGAGRVPHRAQAVGRAAVLSRQQAQTQVGGKAHEYKQHEFHKAVIAPGEAGAEDKAQDQKRGGVRGRLVPPDLQVHGGAEDGKHGKQGKAQVCPGKDQAVAGAAAEEQQKSCQDLLCLCRGEKGRGGRRNGRLDLVGTVFLFHK